ncbi:MAG TPA: hypothetical protein VNJ02_18635 [Vicinamibacterales bacterium]|nr:hypothetical protein [Vicinamibacterales bacterium]
MDLSMYQQSCSAKSKTTGVRCRRTAIPGGTVCYYHGGAAPQVKRAAKERLRELLFPALDKLEKLMEQDQFPSTAMTAVSKILELNAMMPDQKGKHPGRVTTANEDLPTDLMALVALVNEIMAGAPPIITIPAKVKK